MVFEDKPQTTNIINPESSYTKVVCLQNETAVLLIPSTSKKYVFQFGDNLVLMLGFQSQFYVPVQCGSTLDGNRRAF